MSTAIINYVLDNTVQISTMILTILVPSCIGIFIGIWLEKTQTRQQKSYGTVIFTWLHSILKALKFWIKFQIGSTSSSSTNELSNGSSSKTMNGSRTSATTTTTDVATERYKKNYIDTQRESGFEQQFVPQHIAVIMDGNRRYGKRLYGQGSMGHYDGGQKLLQVIEWLHTEGVKALTIYAFSTENWNRESSEVNILMGIFQQYVETDLRPIVFNRKVVVRLICTEKESMPPKLLKAIQDLEEESLLHACDDSLTLNVCLSYGSRGEILNACKSIVSDCMKGTISIDSLTEDAISSRMLTSHCNDPDVLIRTSGEERISNFLLWQLSYSELFFLQKDWPELEKDDFLNVIRSFASTRQRRFGK